MNPPELGPDREEIRIRQKGPISWLNLGLLFDIGFLAAISAATDNRTSRREVLAALDAASGDNPVFDYSARTEGEFVFDYVADLGDGFAATHSIAWLIGRDYLGIGAPGVRVAQPVPPDRRQECPRDAFPGEALPAGQMLILGGDLVYPSATQTQYDDRTIGPYRAARPWQLDAEGRSHGRRLFSIPGNHDWYDGLGAFVQRFCQPGRWMGCWNARQRRSYFAIRLPHQVWIWGVDLATADDFDAPQLDYFQARARELQDGDTVILCVPKPAWVHRKLQDNSAADESKSWQSWNKIDRIAEMVAKRRKDARIGAILSGDLHHYSRYAAPDGAEGAHLITCGGGGAFLIGTTGLPDAVDVGGSQQAELVATYPDRETSRRLSRQVFRLPVRHWDFSAGLGAVMLMLVWYLNTAGPQPLLSRGGDLWAAAGALLIASPLPLLVLGATLYGFFSFARSGSEAARWRVLLAALAHMLMQLGLALVIAAVVKHGLMPLLPGPETSGLVHIAALPVVLLAALMLGWAGAGLLFAGYLVAANALLGLHGMEIYSAQSIEGWKAFLRVRVNAHGIAIYPIGLDRVCHNWTPLGARTPARTPSPPTSGMRTVWRRFSRAAADLARREDVFDDDPTVTHLYAPEKPLEPHLIEGPIIIPRRGIQA